MTAHTAAVAFDETRDVSAKGDVVFVHRSRTGRGFVEVAFAPVHGGGRQITEDVVEPARDR